MCSPQCNYAQNMNTLNPFQLLHFASSALTNRPAKTCQHFFLTFKNLCLCFPPLKKINIWQLSYVFAMFLISFCFWHCQHTLQYAAVPLVTFWNSLARNASSQRIELACIIYIVDSCAFCAFPRFCCDISFKIGDTYVQKVPVLWHASNFCFALTYFGINIADGAKKSAFVDRPGVSLWLLF